MSASESRRYRERRINESALEQTAVGGVPRISQRRKQMGHRRCLQVTAVEPGGTVLLIDRCLETGDLGRNVRDGRRDDLFVVRGELGEDRGAGEAGAVDDSLLEIARPLLKVRQLHLLHTELAGQFVLAV